MKMKCAVAMLFAASLSASPFPWDPYGVVNVILRGVVTETYTEGGAAELYSVGELWRAELMIYLPMDQFTAKTFSVSQAIDYGTCFNSGFYPPCIAGMSQPGFGTGLEDCYVRATAGTLNYAECFGQGAYPERNYFFNSDSFRYWMYTDDLWLSSADGIVTESRIHFAPEPGTASLITAGSIAVLARCFRARWKRPRLDK